MEFVQLGNADKRDVLPKKALERPMEKCEPIQFEGLYELHYRPVFNYVFRTVMNRQVAEDITSEAFLRAYRQFATFQPRLGTFSTWIFAIATNNMRDHFRKNRGVLSVELEGAELEELLARQVPVTDTGGEMDRFETYRQLHEKIRLLKPIYRIAITLYYFEERSHREIAQILGEMPATVRWRLFRARALLAKKLNHSGGEIR